MAKERELDERLGPIEIFGILLGLVGVGIIANPDPSNLLAPGNLGTWFVFGGATCLALGSVLSRRFTSRLPTLVTTGWGLLLGAILLHLCSLGLGEPTPIEWPVALLAAVAYLGSVATAGAYSAYFDLIGRVGAVRTALASYAVPVVTALASWFLLGEVVTVHTVVGFLVIAVGFLLTERYQLRTSLRWMLAHRQSTDNRDD